MRPAVTLAILYSLKRKRIVLHLASVPRAYRALKPAAIASAQLFTVFEPCEQMRARAANERNCNECTLTCFDMRIWEGRAERKREDRWIVLRGETLERDLLDYLHGASRIFLPASDDVLAILPGEVLGALVICRGV